jgi:purine-binding chemotaxis protein CheW
MLIGPEVFVGRHRQICAHAGMDDVALQRRLLMQIGTDHILANSPREGAEAGARGESKFLTFSLAGEEYGIGILKVKEIIGMMSITQVPQAPEFVKGVINLRGKVIPVVDLRLRFGMESAAYSERTCIIVVETTGDTGPVPVGIVVDSVSEVLNIRTADIENTPSFGVKLNTDFILGMAKKEGGVKILLDIDKVLTSFRISLQ